ncbi:MAG: pilin, partial [Patescibacteria group bacterium]
TIPTDTEEMCKARPRGTWASVSLVGTTTPSTGGTSTTGAPSTNSNYHLLAPLPGTDGKSITDVNTTNGLGAYLNLIIELFIGLCAVLSVVMIVMGGIEYMTSELAHTKESGKEKIEHAILGLLIALGAYALLFTINPDLLKSDINPPNAAVEIPVNQPAGTCSNHPEITTEQDCINEDEVWTTGTVMQTGPLGSCDYYATKADGTVDLNDRKTITGISSADCYKLKNVITWKAAAP